MTWRYFDPVWNRSSVIQIMDSGNWYIDFNDAIKYEIVDILVN